MSKNRSSSETRRRMLAGIGIGGSAITLGQWQKPTVKAIVVPAHGEMTFREVMAMGFDSGSSGTINVTFPDLL